MAIGINLLPAKEKNLYRARRHDSTVFMTSVIISCVVIGAAGFLFFYLTNIRYESDSIRDQISASKQKIATLKPIEDKYLALAGNISQIDTLQTNGLNYQEILQNLNHITPADVKIDSIALSSLPKSIITINASAATRREAFIFYNKMIATPRFKDTTLVSFNASDSTDTTSTQNKVTISLTTNLVATPTPTTEANK